MAKRANPRRRLKQSRRIVFSPLTAESTNRITAKRRTMACIEKFANGGGRDAMIASANFANWMFYRFENRYPRIPVFLWLKSREWYGTLTSKILSTCLRWLFRIRASPLHAVIIWTYSCLIYYRPEPRAKPSFIPSIHPTFVAVMNHCSGR